MTGSIYELARQVLVGEAPNPNPDTNNMKGLCLRFIRGIGDRALGVSTYALGGIVPVGGNITAAQAERGFLAAGYSVNSILPGDWIFQSFFQAGENVGHCAISMGVGDDGVHRVLENCLPVRGIPAACGPAVRLTPFSEWGRVSLIVRFPQDHKEPARKPIDVAGLTTAAAAPEATTNPVTGLLNKILYGDPNFDVKNPGGPDFAKENPAWIYNVLEGYEGRAPAARPTNLGSSDLPSIVIIRKPYFNELQTSLPIFGPFSIAVQDGGERLKRGWAKLRSYYLAAPSWGRTYQPIYELGRDNSESYRWPLPFVSNINVRQDSGTGAVGEIELHIPEQVEAEAILTTLAMIQRHKNAILEIWLPTIIHNEKSGGESQVLIPFMTGMIDEVTASPWPHNIKIRVLPQDQFMNLRGMDSSEGKTTNWPGGTPFYEIVQTIGREYGLLFLTGSASSLDALPGLRRTCGTGGYESMGRPPLDVVRDIVVQTAKLQMVPIFGTEVFGKKVLGFLPRGTFLIYDPSAYTPFTTGFWKNEAWSKLFSPIAKLLLGGQQAEGEVAVFYPIDLSRSPKYINNMAAIYDTYGNETIRKNVFVQFINTILSISSAAGLGAGPAERAALDGKTQDALISLVNSWFPSTDGPPTAKYLAPVLNVEEFVHRTPSASDLANPVLGTAGGNTQQRGRRVTAEQAARTMHVNQTPSGDFQLQTPTGEQTFSKHDSLMLFYQGSFARPTVVVPVNGDETVEEGNRFFGSTVTLEVLPSTGVRVGMVAVIVGLGRIDGVWEISAVQRSLGRNDQMSVTLRSQRDLYVV